MELYCFLGRPCSHISPPRRLLNKLLGKGPWVLGARTHLRALAPPWVEAGLQGTVGPGITVLNFCQDSPHHQGPVSPNTDKGQTTGMPQVSTAAALLVFEVPFSWRLQITTGFLKACCWSSPCLTGGYRNGIRHQNDRLPLGL